ncbi:MAG: hypothetical protein ACRDHB_07145, partial [Actinomycetota bacterium]
MDPAELMRAVRRRWPIIAMTTVVAVAVGWLTTTVVPTGPPVRNYEATSVVLSDSNTTFGFASGYNLRTIAALAKVGDVPERVAEQIGYEGDPVILAERISSSGNTETGILRITATSTDPDEAALLSNTFADTLLQFWSERTGVTSTKQADLLRSRISRLREEIRELEEQIGSSTEGDELLVSDRNAKVVT